MAVASGHVPPTRGVVGLLTATHPGPALAVSVVAGLAPTLLVGDTAVAAPPT